MNKTGHKLANSLLLVPAAATTGCCWRRLRLQIPKCPIATHTMQCKVPVPPHAETSQAQRPSKRRAKHNVQNNQRQRRTKSNRAASKQGRRNTAKHESRERGGNAANRRSTHTAVRSTMTWNTQRGAKCDNLSETSLNAFGLSCAPGLVPWGDTERHPDCSLHPRFAALTFVGLCAYAIAYDNRRPQPHLWLSVISTTMWVF